MKIFLLPALVLLGQALCGCENQQPLGSRPETVPKEPQTCASPRIDISNGPASGEHPAKQMPVSIAVALKLVTSRDDTYKTLGWSAIRSLITNPPRGYKNAIFKKTPLIEGLINRDGSTSALLALMSVYDALPTRRWEVILSKYSNDQIGADHGVALLSELSAGSGDQRPNVKAFVPPNTNDDSIRILQQLPIGEEDIRRILSSPTLSTALPAILAATRADLLQTKIDNLSTDLQFIDFDARVAGLVPTSALETLIKGAAQRAFVSLLKRRGPELTYRALLGDFSASPTQKTDVTDDRSVVVTTAGKMVATWYKFIQYPRPGHSIPVVVSLDSASLAPVTSVFSDLRGAGLTPSWTAFVGSDDYVGICFNTVFRSAIVNDTPGIPIYELGMQYKAWAQKPSGEISYKWSVGFKPSPETNWIAIRWRGSAPASASFKITSGILTSQPIVTERNTGWMLYPIIPGSTIEFNNQHPAVIYSDPINFPGLVTSPILEEVCQVIEFNSQTIKRFLERGEPLQINKPAKTNALLAYVSSVQDAITNSHWLLPESDTPDRAAALGLERLATLKELCRLDVSQFPGLPPGVPEETIQLRERLDFLNGALALVGYRIFEHFGPKIERDLVLTGALMNRVVQARANIDDALKALASMTTHDQRMTLTSAATILNLTPPGDTNDVDLLAAALFGAQEAIASLDRDLEEETAFRTDILKRLQFEGYQGTLKMISDPTIL